ncbi:MAG: hypothetical protein DCE86_04995 [Flavobacteriaceae bacterium]|nr:MAG: hypothetical protein DCE86_04995 [Flavobacteriaceae bacterium]
MSRTNTVIGILAGAAIGAAVGILFAPDKGQKTRKKIKDGFDHQKVDLESGFDELVANAQDTKEDVIAALEKKLADLKAQATAAGKK